jgi:CRP-like cAMP-binding protein
MDRPTFEPLAATLRKRGPISDRVLDLLRDTVQVRTFETDTWLLRGGEVATFCFWIETGLAREYYVAEDGTEHTRRFMEPGALTGSLLDLLSRAPAVTWIQALEPTRTLRFEYAHFIALCDQHPELQRIARRFMEQLYVIKARREHELLALSARQRLDRWQQEHPDLDARVSRRHLASYLGITPEHLSRLRRG